MSRKVTLTTSNYSIFNQSTLPPKDHSPTLAPLKDKSGEATKNSRMPRGKLSSGDKSPGTSARTKPEDFPFCALPDYYFERTASLDHPDGISLRVEIGESESRDLPQQTSGAAPRAGLSLERWSSPTTFGK
jgi:hypothetical protein